MSKKGGLAEILPSKSQSSMEFFLSKQSFQYFSYIYSHNIYGMLRHRKMFLMFFLTCPNVVTFTQTDYELWFATPVISYEYLAPNPSNYQGLNLSLSMYKRDAYGLMIYFIDEPP